MLAQSSNGGIIFQALARDVFHNPANSRKIYIQSSIIQHSKSGLVVLSEEHITNTDYTGVFTINIGLGSKIGGTRTSLEDIDWVNGPYFLNIKIAITPVSPTDDWFFHKEWVDLGTAAFGVVPYALNVLGAKQVNTSSTDSIMYISKLAIADTSAMLSVYSKKSYVDSLLSNKVNLNDLSLLVRAFDSASLSNRINMRLLSSDTISLSNRIEDKLYVKDSTLKYVTPTQLAAKTVDLSPINSILNTKLAISDTVSMLSSYVKMADFSSALITKLNSSDTAAMLSSYIREVNFLPILNTKLNINDTAAMLTARFARDTLSLSSRINLKVDLLNRSINMNSPMDYSNEKYPSVKAIKDYVDTKINLIASDLVAVSPLSFTSPLVNTSSIVSMPSASSTTDGYLTSTNWNIFNNKINATEKATNNGVATLGADGKIPSSQIPAISFSRVDVVTSEAAMLLLPVTLTGSFAIRTDVNKSFVLSQLPATNLVNWVEIVAPGTVTTVNGQAGPAVSLTTADIAASMNKNYVTDAMLSGVLSNTSGTNTGDETSLTIKTKIGVFTLTGSNTGDQDLSSFATITNLNLKANSTDVNTSLALKADASDIVTSLATKVDKVTGKALSTNDYTTLEKDKLAAITGSNTGDQILPTILTLGAVAGNATITASTGTKITYDAKGLVTAGEDATTADIAASTNKNYVTDAMLSGVLSNTSGTNTGDQDLSSFATITNLNLKANSTDVNTSLALKADASGMVTSLATKVDKVTGKELSTNDYTTVEKTKLSNITGSNTGDQILPTILTLGAVAGNATITASTGTKITYDAKGLVTAGEDATTADIAASMNKNYVTDAMLSGVLSNTSGTNTGDQDLSSFATTTNLNLKANSTDVNTSLALKADASDIVTSLATKVDKVTGKALSTNDYTTLEKTKLSNITGSNTGDQILPTILTLGAVAGNATITASTGTKITYDAKGLVTAGADATTADIAASINKNYVTDAMLSGVLSNTSGTNTGDQDLSSFATITNLNLKANSTDVNTSLALKADASDMVTSLATKVDKVTGKALSTNDYTTLEKDKLAAITGTNTGDETAITIKTKLGVATLTGVNTGDNAVNNLYSGLVSNANHTGDVTGSSDLTLATVNSNIGAFGSTTLIPTITTNAKGLVTAVSTNAVIAPAGTLTGTTLNATVVNSSLTSVGTIASGIWSGTTIGINKGGTGATSRTDAFDALSPMTSAGDLIYGGASGSGTRLAAGNDGQVLTLNSSLNPTWAAAPGINSVGAVSGTSIANGASITSGVLNLAPANQLYPGVITTGTQYINGSKFFNADLYVNGISVGRGLGSFTTNTTIGTSANGSLTHTDNTTGYNNTAIGYRASNVMSTGESNTSLGSMAMSSNNTGSYNVAIGSDAMAANSNGSINVIVGHFAGKYFTGTGNTIIGGAAGSTFALGSNLTLLNNSVIMGKGVKLLGNNEDNVIVIGPGAISMGSNSTVIGNSGMLTTKVWGDFSTDKTITGTQLISNIATGTAPLVVSSTTPVANLSIEGNAATANVAASATNVSGIVLGANGGTGIANTGKTIALGGNISTGSTFTTEGALATVGNFSTSIVSTGPTNITLPVSGTLATLLGTETLNNKTMVAPVLGVASATSISAGTITSTGDITAKRYVQFSNTAVSPPSSGAMTLDLSRGNVIQVDLAYSITGITFTNEAVGTYIIKFKQTVGAKTINFPDAWMWSGGVEPSVTTTVGRTDIVTLINDGTTYYAAIVQNFF